jgi:ankyrin repeat protein
MDPIRYCCKVGDCEQLKLLLSLNKNYDINNNDHNGMTPLHIGLIYGNDICVEFLIKYGADIHATINCHQVMRHILLEQPFESRYRLIYYGGNFFKLLKL